MRCHELMLGLCLSTSLGCLATFTPPEINSVSVSEMKIQPPSLMVAQKSHRTAYLVLDPAKVPPAMPVLVDGVDRGGKMVELQTFVRRDLRNALSTYFDRVEVVAPGAPPPEAGVVVDVKLDRIECVLTGRRGAGAGIVVHAGAAVLTWGLGLRLSESNNYLYSFAGESAGQAAEDPGFVYRTMFEAAITDLLKGYTDKGIHSRVLEASEPAPTRPHTTHI